MGLSEQRPEPSAASLQPIIPSPVKTEEEI